MKLKNEIAYSFLMGPMRTAVTETLKKTGIEANLAKETRVSPTLRVQQAKLMLKGAWRGAGFLTAYSGGPCIGLSMTKMLAYMDSRNEAAIIFVDGGVVYLVPLSSIRGEKDGINMWQYIMADKDAVSSVTGADGVSATITYADPARLESLAAVRVEMDPDIRKRYEQELAACCPATPAGKNTEGSAEKMKYASAGR